METHPRTTRQPNKTYHPHRGRSGRLRALSLAALVLLSAVTAIAPAWPAPPAPTGDGEYTLTSKTIWSFYTETPPALDDPQAPIWEYPLQVIGLVPGHVALSGGTSLDIRSLYTDTDLYIRIIWSDVVEDSGVPRWVYHDGNWTFTSPFEDGLGLYFPISDPKGLFPEEGCMRTCHIQDWENPQNQERKFTYEPGEKGDLWFWSAGLTNPWDFALDAWVDDTPSDNNVGYHEDPEMGLGLVKNRHLTEYMEYVYLSRPVFMQDPNKEPSEGPEYLLRGEEVVFDQNFKDPKTGEPGMNPVTHQPWQNGDVVGGYILDHLPTQGLGQVAAVGSYDVSAQTWSVVLRRALDTGDPVHDVIFDDLTKTYQFALSLFGDIMGGGDISDPFTDPTEDGEGARCVMNKVTNTIGLRFRPVVRAARASAGAPATWDAAAWAASAPPMLHELIHRSGEIHDSWDYINVSASHDGTDLYVHLAYEDRNQTPGYRAELAMLRPGPLSVEETSGLISWHETFNYFVTSQGDADVWHWEWNATSMPEGEATDMLSSGGRAAADPDGPDDVSVATWYDGVRRHIVMSRALDTLHDDEDQCFHDLARTYSARVALHTSDWAQWLITYPITINFAPDAGDSEPPARPTGLTVTDGRDSNVTVTWDGSSEPDFAHYRVYAAASPYTSVVGMEPVARVSDPAMTEVHLRGLTPGQTWHFAVVSVDDSRNLDPSVETVSVAVTDTTAPPPLEGVRAYDNLDSDILVRWNATPSPDFDRYEVFIENAPFTSVQGLEPVATVRSGAVGSHRVAGLDVGVTYHAAVVAVDWAGNAVRAVASASGTPTDLTPPPEVRGLDASTPLDADSDGEVSLRWRPSASVDVSHYNVYMSLTPIETVQNFEPRARVDAPGTAVRIAGLNPGRFYHFAVTAVDRAGHEGASKWTVSCRASTAAPPPPPVGLAAVQASDDSARVSWTPSNGSLVVRHLLYMGTSPIVDVNAANVTLVGNITSPTTTSHLVTGLEDGVTYHFTLVAVDARGKTSAQTLPSASVTVQVPKEEGPSPLERWGVPIMLLVVIVVLAAALWVMVSRVRRYGSLLSQRPPWKRPKNGANGGGGEC